MAGSGTYEDPAAGADMYGAEPVAPAADAYAPMLKKKSKQEPDMYAAVEPDMYGAEHHEPDMGSEYHDPAMGEDHYDPAGMAGSGTYEDPAAGADMYGAEPVAPTADAYAPMLKKKSKQEPDMYAA